MPDQSLQARDGAHAATTASQAAALLPSTGAARLPRADGAELGVPLLQSLRETLERREQQLAMDLRRRLLNAAHDEEDPSDSAILVISHVSVLTAIAEVRLAGVARAIEELRDIAAARDRMRGGCYGLCKGCGEAIAEDRLRCHPTAKRCRDCQDLKDARERRV